MVHDGSAIGHEVLLAALVLETDDLHRREEAVHRHSLAVVSHFRVQHQGEVAVGLVAKRATDVLVLAHRGIERHIDRRVVQFHDLHFALVGVGPVDRFKDGTLEEIHGGRHVVRDHKRIFAHLLFFHVDARCHPALVGSRFDGDLVTILDRRLAHNAGRASFLRTADDVHLVGRVCHLRGPLGLIGDRRIFYYYRRVVEVGSLDESCQVLGGESFC